MVLSSAWGCSNRFISVSKEGGAIETTNYSSLTIIILCMSTLEKYVRLGQTKIILTVTKKI